jgi:integrase
VLGKLPVDAVDAALVMKVLEPIWTEKPETASRLRGRIENILDWATALGLRHGDNPARWRGHLAKLLPRKTRIRKVAHHAALPHAEIGAFMAEVRKLGNTAGRALEFLILTAARTGETLGAKFSEVDFATRTWVVPAGRMKARREHRVPLSPAAMAVLQAMHAVKESAFIFPGERESRPLSPNAIAQVMGRMMGRGDVTVHGFRSSFRTWAAERTSFPREVVEAALAHVAGDKVEAAYQRSDLFEKRRKLMNQWAAWCASPARSGEVVPMRRGQA